MMMISDSHCVHCNDDLVRFPLCQVLMIDNIPIVCSVRVMMIDNNGVKRDEERIPLCAV